jgi:hypothetical protein
MLVAYPFWKGERQGAGLYGENFYGVKQLPRSIAQIYRKTDRRLRSQRASAAH